LNRSDFHLVYFPSFAQNGNILAVSASQSPPTFVTGETRVVDLGNYNVLIGTRAASEPPAAFHPWLGDKFVPVPGWNAPPWGYFNIPGPGSATPPPAGPFRVLMRYFPDASKVGLLQPGEVALYSECNFKGSAAVFHDSVGDLTFFKGLGLEKSASVKSPGASFVLFAEANFGGRPLDGGIDRDFACLTTPVGSVSILPEENSGLIYASADSCPNCRLQGADLSGLPLAGKSLQNADLRYAKLIKTDLTGADLTDADLRGADLSGAILPGAVLTNAKFDQAILRGANLSGQSITDAQFGNADLSCAILAGLPDTPNDLRQFTIKYDPSCRIDLTNSLLRVDQLPLNGSWRAVNLTNVQVFNAAGQPGLGGIILSSKAKPLNLSGAEMAGFRFDGVTADYLIAGTANLNGATFRGAKLTRADFRLARLHGADFTNANLAGAHLGGAGLTITDGVPSAAVFDQAFLRNVNFSSTDLTGVSFKRASFFGSQRSELAGCTGTNGFMNNCALATKATMNNTQFADAFLYGVDFTSATLQGADFSGAILIAANFGSATLDPDPLAGTRSDFSGSYLQGATVNSKASNKTTFQNAFVDFNPAGNAFNMFLDGDHTAFPGWATQSQPVCLSLVYGHESSIGDNQSITCPSGAGGPCGSPSNSSPSSSWASKSTISGAYTSNVPTFGQKSAKICTTNIFWMAPDPQ
jgi:uncharacterized protein YjbI with pentapeptide repeats